MPGPSLSSAFRQPVVSNRLVIRRLQDRDAQAFCESFADGNYAMRDFFIFPEEFEPDREFALSIIFPTMKYFEREQNMHYLGVFRIGAPDNMVGMFICNRDQNNLVRAAYFTKPSERRKGYGSEMYESLMKDILRETGQKIMVAEVRKDNAASLSLLRSLGFEIQGVRTGTNNAHETRKMIAMARSI